MRSSWSSSMTCEFDRLGVFTYSPEEDTPAAVMDDQIEEEQGGAVAG